MPEYPFRLFVVTPGGVATLAELDAQTAARVDAALDIMLDDRVPEDQAVELLGACIRDGRNPEHFARHFVKLRRAARSASQ